MTAGGGDLQGAFYRFLAFDVGEIGIVIRWLVEDAGEIDAGGAELQFTFEKGDGFAEVPDGKGLDFLDDGRFGRVFGGDQEADLAALAGLERDGERTAHRANGAGQGEFADHDEVIELIGGELFAGGENADGNGEVETWAFLAKISRCEIHRDFAFGHAEAGIGEGGADAIARFLHRGIWKANNDHESVAESRVDFDFDRTGFDAIHGGGTDLREHAWKLLPMNRPEGKERRLSMGEFVKRRWRIDASAAGR